MKYSLAFASIATLVFGAPTQPKWQIHFFENECDTSANVLTCGASGPSSCIRVGDVTSIGDNGSCLWGPGVGTLQTTNVSLSSVQGMYASPGSNCRFYFDETCDDSPFGSGRGAENFVQQGNDFSACRVVLPPANELYYKCG